MSQHTFSTAFEHMNPTLMTYNSGPMWLLILIILYGLFAKFFCPTREGDDDDGEDQLVEGLEEYYIALKADDKNSLIGQEETFIQKYGVKTFSDEQFAKLRNAETADVEHIMMGVATYRILESLEYQQAFQYEPARKHHDGSCKRDDVIIITTHADELSN